MTKLDSTTKVSETISAHSHCHYRPCQHQDCASHSPRLSAEPEKGEKGICFKQNQFDEMFKKNSRENMPFIMIRDIHLLQIISFTWAHADVCGPLIKPHEN